MRLIIAALITLALAGPALAQPVVPSSRRPASTATDTSAKPAPAKAPEKPAKPVNLPKLGGLSPGTPSPWGIAPELRPKDARRALWYLQAVATAASMTFTPVAEARRVAYAMTVPLRSDRQFLGARVVFPVGGSPSNGVTSNSFSLARGGSATTSLLYGIAFPISTSETLSFDAVTYARGGVDLLARSWGASLPYGGYVDKSRDTRYAIPGFSTQLGRATYLREGPRHRIRAVIGDYTPIIYSPIEGPRERNFLDLGALTFRPFESNTSILGFGTAYPLDRQFGPQRTAVRGGDVYVRSGDFEAEVLSARQETHPSEPFNGWRYRGAVGGRLAVVKPTWGLGISSWNMYGDNLAVRDDPTSRTVPGGHECLWAVDGSTRVSGGLHAYGAFATSLFERNERTYPSGDDAVVLGLVQKGWPGKNGEVRLYYQTVGPNYEDLNVRNQLYMPANYRIWGGDISHPFKGGNLSFSLRQSEQLKPDIFASGGFANSDAFFPSSAHNRGKGQILDWLAMADVEIPQTPCHLYLSWEEVAYARSLTPGLQHSATHRTVGQQMAMLRIKASPQLAVDVGVIHFQTGGTEGVFERTMIFNEKQTVPRLSLTYTPSQDTSAYLMLQRFGHTDGVLLSNGLNNYHASTVLLEVQSRWGGKL